MTTAVLAYFPSPPRGVWHLGPLPVRAYALFIIIGIVVALVIGDRRWEARGGERGVIYDIALWAVPFGLVGGRLYHLATDFRTYFGEGGAGLGAAVRIWDGGLGIWGAVALGGVGAWIGCRRRGIPLPAFGDAVAPGIVLAQAIGRLGNYFNQELFGRETTLPWGLEIFYRRDPSGFVDVHSLDGVSTGERYAIVQPTFLYELLWNLVVFAVLILLDRRFRIGHGRLFAIYVAGYCFGRFCVELLRDDVATHIAGIRINSFTSTFVFIGAVVYLILAPKGREDPATLGGPGAEKLEPQAVPALAPVAAASGAEGAGGTAAAAQAEAVEAEEAEPSDAEAVVEEADEAETDAAEAEVEPTEAAQEAEEPEAEIGTSDIEVAEAEEAGLPQAEAAEIEEAVEPEAEETGVDETQTPETDVAEESEAEADEVEETEEPEAEEVAEIEEAEEPDAEADEPEDGDEPAAEVLDAEEPEPEELEAEEPEAEEAEEPEAAQSEADTAAEAAAPVVDRTEEPMPRWRARLGRLTRRSGR